MGNQQQVSSRFADQNKWMPLAQTSRKQLIQNKLSREIVEKHYLKNVEWNDVSQDSIIFDWRNDPNTARSCVELLEIRKLKEQDNAYCLSTCHTTDKETDLLVYTEHIFKLYEQNPKCPLEEKDQLAIFKGIIEGVDVLARKFGEFAITKDMVGYNSGKRGKAWINQNYCVNKVQTKRNVRTPQERSKWEKEVIEELINLCKLCSVDKSIKNCKFFNVMDLIMRNRLYQFASFRDFGPFKDIDLSQGLKDGRTTREYRTSQEKISSGHGSADQKKLQEQRRVKIFSKTFEFPILKVHEPDRNMTNLEAVHNLTCNAAPTQNIILGGANRQNPPHPVRNNSAVQKMNHVEIPSNPGNPRGNDTFLYDAHQYNKKHRQTQPAKDSHDRERDRAKKPEHYALLQELQESRSSRASCRMMPKQMIQLVDSVVMVENNYQSEHSRNYHKNMALEESVILNYPRR